MKATGWRRAVAAAVLTAGAAASAMADESVATNEPPATNAVVRQTICPVMEKPIDKARFVDFEGKRVYVCCRWCVRTVKKDPAKYIAMLEGAGITLDKVQTTCPVMGGPIDKKLFVDHNGKRIYVCCAGCIEPLKKDAETYIKKLEAEGVVLDPAGKP